MAPEGASEPTEPAPLPPSVRWIRRLRHGAERRGRLLILGTLVAGLVVLLSRGFYTVDNGETAAVLRFGALQDDSVGPGLRFRLPMETVLKARTGEVSRLEIRGDFEEELTLLTGDENFIEARLVVQYRIRELSDFLFTTEGPEELLVQVVRATLVEFFAATTVDEVLTSAKASLQTKVREESQARLDLYGSGVTLVSVNLQAVNPPREASTAFRAVNDSRAEAAKARNRAEGQRDRNLRLARGESEKTLTGAQAAADTRLQGARGAADRFRALLEQDRRASALTRTELYHDTIRQVLPQTRLVVLPPGDTPLDIHLLPDGAQGGRGAPPVPPGRSMDDR